MICINALLNIKENRFIVEVFSPKRIKQISCHLWIQWGAIDFNIILLHILVSSCSDLSNLYLAMLNIWIWMQDFSVLKINANLKCLRTCDTFANVFWCIMKKPPNGACKTSSMTKVKQAKPKTWSDKEKTRCVA